MCLDLQSKYTECAGLEKHIFLEVSPTVRINFQWGDLGLSSNKVIRSQSNPNNVLIIIKKTRGLFLQQSIHDYPWATSRESGTAGNNELRVLEMILLTATGQAHVATRHMLPNAIMTSKRARRLSAAVFSSPPG